MKTEQNVKVEPAGKTEADWSSAPRSSTDLPEFVEEDFERLIDKGEEPDHPAGEAGAGAAATEAESGPQAEEGRADAAADPFRELSRHMTAILEVGGKARDRRVAAEDSSSMIQRMRRPHLWRLGD